MFVNGGADCGVIVVYMYAMSCVVDVVIIDVVCGVGGTYVVLCVLLDLVFVVAQLCCWCYQCC